MVVRCESGREVVNIFIPFILDSYPDVSQQPRCGIFFKTALFNEQIVLSIQFFSGQVNFSTCQAAIIFFLLSIAECGHEHEPGMLNCWMWYCDAVRHCPNINPLSSHTTATLALHTENIQERTRTTPHSLCPQLQLRYHLHDVPIDGEPRIADIIAVLMLRLLSYGPNFPSQPSASHHAGSFDRDDTAKGSPIRATSRWMCWKVFRRSIKTPRRCNMKY